ncbi:MAG: helix-turn-helix transcriptional regulator [Synechococcales bacterium]|nr:helix-turn-helix transcriptional regulator [Synechococcales bacterium]
MKEGTKYYPLFTYLRDRSEVEITLTISEIESLIEGNLPASARSARAWWSNRIKGAVQAAAWTEAGYNVAVADLEKQTVTFLKFQAEYRVQRIAGEIVWTREAIRALRHHMGLTQAVFAQHLGVRRQTVSEWENGVYEPERSTAKLLQFVAKEAAFTPPEPPPLDGDEEGSGESAIPPEKKEA